MTKLGNRADAGPTPEERAARVEEIRKWFAEGHEIRSRFEEECGLLLAELDREKALEEPRQAAYQAALARAEKAEARLLGAQAELDDLRKYLARDRTERDAALAQVKQLREALTGQVRVLFTDYGACFCGPYSGQHSAACAAAKAALSATEPKS